MKNIEYCSCGAKATGTIEDGRPVCESRGADDPSYRRFEQATPAPPAIAEQEPATPAVVQYVRDLRYIIAKLGLKDLSPAQRTTLALKVWDGMFTEEEN